MIISKTRLVKFLSPCLVLVPSLVNAGIAQQPLFLQSQVKPNIFFLVDDSGSMDWEILKSNGAKGISAYSTYRNDGVQSWWPDPAPAYRYSILEACAGYNVLYYDPSVTYQPWVGEDKNGVAYGDQSITAARKNPYDSGEGTVNLSAADIYGFYTGYYEWSDDGDGVFERGECPDASLISFNYSTQFVSTTSAAGAKVMTAAQKTNFANWYTYYRKREYVMKAALLGIVNGATERMGLGTLHRNNSVGYPIADMSVSSNKSSLLTQIEKISSDHGTPLRSKLVDVGEYFKGTSSSNLFGSVPSPVSPILDNASGGSCQQNFAIVMSDGFWNGSNPSVGNADSGGAGDNNNTSFDGGIYADSYSNTLADVAMHYYENDLNGTLADEVPTSSYDSNKKQHLVTYTVAFGVNGSLASGPDSDDVTFNWPQPVADTETTIDDMRHAALNGRGEFLSASSPQGLTAALSQAINSIEGRTSAASSLATNSTRLSTSSKIYQAKFSSSSWGGELLAFQLDSNTGIPANVELWDAADLIPAENDRKIYTSTSSTKSGVVFEHTNLTSAQQALITEAEVNYIRGDRASEGGAFRSRAKLLGDIVHSNPLLAGQDNFNYYSLEMNGSSSTYATYMTGTTETWQKGNRPDVIYVGANDGMLHAFRGEGDVSAGCNPSSKDCEGEELFGYVPKALISKLSDLTKPAYTHQYYVDGSARQGDAYITYEGSQDRWGTALIGVLGAGGKGVFALDISDPYNFGTGDVLWDLDDSDLSDLGYTYGQPAIVKLANGEWGVILSNGYYSANHEAVLYIISLETGSVIKRLATGAQGDSSATNGLSSPIPVDYNGDKVADAVYAGDLQGNLWKFDISDSNTNKWDVAFSHKDKGKTVYDPLFTACTSDACTSKQPITAKPQVIRGSSGGYIVLFGTGKFFEDGDNTDVSQTQTFYGIQDDGDTVSGRSSLVQQTISYEKTAAQTGFDHDVRVTSDNGVNYSLKDGWYLDFNSSNYPGERIVSDSLVLDGRVIFPTLIPETSPCAFGGTSWLMSIDSNTGSRLTISPFDLNGDNAITGGDLVDSDGDGNGDTAGSGEKSNVGILTTPTVVYDEDGDADLHSQGSNGDKDRTKTSITNNLGRQSWQQLK